ncbi:MAG: cob(I)yrinic acid a,c-diamide adenosyltransferase, partial [Clostridia bacterium]|nr:cob(I)yrinic acid a,c-diamide adenosyltransferase [Clostridia bacterium]
RTDLMGFLEKEGKKREIVLTGRAPAQELIDVADYATEMRKEKHPFDKGVAGRKGIEF